MTAIEPQQQIDRLKESLDLCEEENTRARQLVLWCAERMPVEHRKELAKMVRQRLSLSQEEENREDLRRLLKWSERLIEHIEDACDRKEDPEPMWWVQAAHMAAQLRSVLQDIEPLPVTLHEVREELLK